MYVLYCYYAGKGFYMGDFSMIQSWEFDYAELAGTITNENGTVSTVYACFANDISGPRAVRLHS